MVPPEGDVIGPKGEALRKFMTFLLHNGEDAMYHSKEARRSGSS